MMGWFRGQGRPHRYTAALEHGAVLWGGGAPMRLAREGP
jgi:hypothetical protein